MAQSGIYESVVPLSQARHAGHSVQTGEDYAFSARLTAAPLLGAEFADASAEYAVVFAGPPEGLMPVVILGLRADENLFVGPDASWRARYKPAFVRRYPFIFDPEAGGEGAVLCVDESYGGLNREGRGSRLFGSEGQPTPYVEGILKFLQEFQIELQRTRNLCRRLQELQLLTGIEATIALPEGGNVALKGMLGVDRTRLNALEGDVLTDLLRKDGLELIYLHLHSLRNLGLLRERLAMRQAGRATGTGAKNGEHPDKPG